MSDTQLEKKNRSALKERGQYFLAFAVVASMLLVAGFPLFVIFFFGIFAYFLLRMFATGSRSETREVFEFYLTANEMLRDDERRWYGFELNDAIRRGEEIVRRMSPAPPLVYFALGALQNKAGNHKSAVTNLAYVAENAASDEASHAFASPELQNYVRVLRKIEREPADAPLTSAAVRSLERARKLRAKTLLEESRQKFATPPVPEEVPRELEAGEENVYQFQPLETLREEQLKNEGGGDGPASRRPRILKAKHETSDPYADRKPISEVLHDIYDKNIQ
ncbi:MAG TPA: hypothetical protein VNA22_05675 [Pyrinomonadaceae bacterium]|nr:hypothetical protein [Pyrinomonadaceae bacterium]